ncbi:MAG TPA: hypothetical protein VF403_19030 [Kofleriaceae bacterium]
MRNFLAALLFTTACGSAYADQLASPQPGTMIAIDVAPVKLRAPYDVQVIREDGETLPTYAAKDRFYVEGLAGQRYTIRVSNPTGHRVEAVVSVDGLDAVDGEAGDLRKRGYIVPAYGTVNIEGFRTSLSDVATFRFSSVDGSYAGQKGKARNVGVIAVALFEEEHAPDVQMATPTGGYNYTDDLDGDESWGPAASAEKRDRPTRTATADDKPAPAKGAPHRRMKKAPAEAPRAETTAAGGANMSPPPRQYEEHIDADDDRNGGDAAEVQTFQPRDAAPPTYRPGLGTEFGEARSSAANYTRFTRSTTRPIAIAELRYNDAAGLMALGIAIQPSPDENEIMTRETADPFPGDRFARPAR